MRKVIKRVTDLPFIDGVYDFNAVVAGPEDEFIDISEISHNAEQRNRLHFDTVLQTQNIFGVAKKNDWAVNVLPFDDGTVLFRYADLKPFMKK